MERFKIRSIGIIGLAIAIEPFCVSIFPKIDIEMMRAFIPYEGETSRVNVVDRFGLSGIGGKGLNRIPHHSDVGLVLFGNALREIGDVVVPIGMSCNARLRSEIAHSG